MNINTKNEFVKLLIPIYFKIIYISSIIVIILIFETNKTKNIIL